VTILWNVYIFFQLALGSILIPKVEFVYVGKSVLQRYWY